MGAAPGHPTAGRSRWLVLWSLVAVAVVAAAVLGVVSLTGESGSGSDSADSAGSSPPGGGGGSATTAPARPPTEAEIDDLVADLSGFVADQRGLEFKRKVPVVIKDDSAFRQRVIHDFDEDADLVAAFDPLYKALGLIDPDDDLVDLYREALGDAVIGFYDPESKELVVRGAAITPSVRVTLAHELTHALDDQWFDLDRPEYDDADDEIGFGFSAVVEGNAVTVENAYLDTLSRSEREEYYDEQFAYDLPKVPLALLQLIGAPYQYGAPLIGALRDADHGGRGKLDAAFAHPPHTSEQVLHPGRFLDHEPAVAVTHPAADGPVVWDGQLGELTIGLVLGDRPGAHAAADGWGGDWVTSWKDGDRSCARATMVGDTPDDSDELDQAWTTWAEGGDLDANVKQDRPGGAVTVTSCTPASSSGGVPSSV
jgi:hypothetical protein